MYPSRSLSKNKYRFQLKFCIYGRDKITRKIEGKKFGNMRIEKTKEMHKENK